MLSIVPSDVLCLAIFVHLEIYITRIRYRGEVEGWRASYNFIA